MSIRRVGSNPFVNSANLIQSQRRIERVEKHIGAEDTELKSEEEALESLNKLHQAELDELEAERAEKAKQTESLRAQLVLSDGYEARAPEELVDLTGGAREAYERDLQELREREKQAKKPGMSLAHLARASVYERVSREERAAAQRAEAERVETERAEAERLALELAASEEAQAAVRDSGVPMLDEEVLPDTEDEEPVDWMAEELALRQQEEEGADDAGDEDEEYEDPAADSFLASLEDIENLEDRPVEDPHAGGFLASLDDIENLETAPAPDVEAEAEAEAETYEASAEEESVDEEDGGYATSADVEAPIDVEDVFEQAPTLEPEAVLLPFDEETAPEPMAQAAPEPMEQQAEAEVALPFDDEEPPADPVRVPAEQES